MRTHLPQSTTRRQIGACVCLPSLHLQSTHLSPNRASVLSLYIFSRPPVFPSVGPVQSESLAELLLSRLISKSCLFHLSKCLHSQLLYEEADKGCLLSTEDWLLHPQPSVGAGVYLYACTAYAKLCLREIIFVLCNCFLVKMLGTCREASICICIFLFCTVYVVTLKAAKVVDIDE